MTKKFTLKENGKWVDAEIVAEFTVAMPIKKGTKAVIIKTEKGYFVCNKNKYLGE